MSENILIRRAPRDSQHPYMQLLRKTAQDLDLTLEERGILIYILSLPHYMITNIVEMGKKNGIGRDKTRKIINSLKNHGYCYCETIKDENGRYKATEYLFSEEKMEIQKKIPETENQGLDSSSWNSGSGSQEKKDSPHITSLDKKYKSKEKKKEKKKSSASASPPPKSKEKDPPPDPEPQKKFIKHGSHVKLTEEEYQKLCEAEGKPETDEMIEDMNDYCEALKPKGYSCYYSALKRWFRKEKKRKQEKKKERKFAPCSDDNRALQALKSMDEDAL